MSRVQGVLARIRAVFRPSDAEGRMEEEFRFHLAMEEARLVREGLPPDAARRQARLTFGGLEAHRETMRARAYDGRTLVHPSGGFGPVPPSVRPREPQS
jgi:hypothetical protein